MFARLCGHKTRDPLYGELATFWAIIYSRSSGQTYHQITPGHT